MSLLDARMDTGPVYCCSGKRFVAFVPAKHNCLEQAGKSEQPLCSAPHTLEQQFSCRKALGPLDFLPGSVAKFLQSKSKLLMPKLAVLQKKTGMTHGLCLSPEQQILALGC